MKRALAVLAPAALVVGLVGCMGADDDDAASSTEAASTTPATEPEVTAELTPTTTPETATEDTLDVPPTIGGEPSTDVLGDIFPNLDQSQLECLVDEVGDVTQALDPATAQAIADECGIDPADLVPDMSAVSIPDLGDISIPDNMDEMIKQVFPGLSDEQAECLAEQFGSDFDASKAAQVAETCDIDPSDLTPGG